MIHGSARQAWHDAFDPEIASMKVRFTGRGKQPDFYRKVEKGLVQSVIERLKRSDPVAYTWGMMAYSPIDGICRVGRGPVYAWLEERLKDRFRKLDFNTEREAITRLMFVAIRDAMLIDWGQPKKRREFVHMGRLIGVDADTYKKHYHRYYLFMREQCLDLAERALPPVAHFIELWVSRRNADVLEEIHTILYGRIA